MQRWMVICLFWLSGCTTLPTSLDSPHASLVDLRPQALGLFQQDFAIVLRLTNPNNMDLTIQGVRLDIQLDEIHFAHVVSNQETLLPRLGTAQVTLQATTQLTDWLRQLRRLQRDTRKSLDYRISGNLFIGAAGIRLPIDEKGSVDLKELQELLDPAAPPSRTRDHST